MPTVKQAFEYYKKALSEGKGDMRTGHPYISEEEAAKREKNQPDDFGKVKTKIAWDSCDADCYRQWHIERKRWMLRAQKNPSLATNAMLVQLGSATEREIDAIIESLGEIMAQQSNPAVPQAQIDPFIPSEEAEADFNKMYPAEEFEHKPY